MMMMMMMIMIKSFPVDWLENGLDKFFFFNFRALDTTNESQTHKKEL